MAEKSLALICVWETSSMIYVKLKNATLVMAVEEGKGNCEKDVEGEISQWKGMWCRTIQAREKCNRDFEINQGWRKMLWVWE